MSTSRDHSGPGVAVKFVSAGVAGCVAESITIPLDTAKVRLQVQYWLPYSDLAKCTHPYVYQNHARVYGVPLTTVYKYFRQLK